MIGSTIALICSPVRRAILAEVSAERDRQDAKWGGVPGIDRRDDHTYPAVLGEEVGEACKAWIGRDTDNLRVELIQTAAVALAWVEELDNGGSLPRPTTTAPQSSPEVASPGPAVLDTAPEGWQPDWALPPEPARDDEAQAEALYEAHVRTLGRHALKQPSWQNLEEWKRESWRRELRSAGVETHTGTGNEQELGGTA